RYGGGIYDFGKRLNLTHVTMSGNIAIGDGVNPTAGNLYGSTNPTLIAAKSSVIHAGSPVNCYLSGGMFSSAGYNIDSDGTCLNGSPASGDQVTDPQLAALANNGGPTLTHALRAGSPAIDTASNVGCPPIDQRGYLRPANSTCDKGAFEYGAKSGDVFLPLIVR
ncbi:MAG: hypothetical protein LC737_00340, partial [Chloroflexi bacterium]|nr:hypothetical protein [Chloroflexota bacterium]